MYKFFVQQIDQQKRKAVIVGCIPFEDLLGKVKYSFRDETAKESYQRRIDKKRAKGIASYIERTIVNSKDDLPIFPTSIILAFNVDDEDKPLDLKIGELMELPELPDSILIVDGQHRFEGMRILFSEQNQLTLPFFNDGEPAHRNKIKDYIKSFHFNCCVLLNYDLWEQAQVFATVNFNQKKVNKSLFYDIYGIKAPDGESESISKQNEIYLSHKLVKFLNETNNSPLNSMVKMLGQGNGYISQAFLVEQFLRLFGPSNIWGDIAESYRSGKKDRSINIAAIELVAYFNAIKKVFSEFWPSDKNAPDSILYKTTGIGAMTRFLTDLHHQMDDQLLDQLRENPKEPEVYKKLSRYFRENLNKIKGDAGILFGRGEGSLFKGTGGGGSQTNLYKEIYQRWRDAQ